MGLFSRKEAKSSRKTAHRPRPSVSSEAQAASLRVRARRRLTGAVALVLAAVIVLPMLLDGEPRPVPASIEIVVPERNAAFNPELSAPPSEQSEPAQVGDQDKAQVGNVDVPTTDLTQDKAASVLPATQPPATTPKSDSAPAPAVADPKPAVPKSPATPISEPAPAPAPKVDQTEQALAILEGRTPPASSASGSFVLQVASYGTDADAKARVDKLKSQGVSNAFIEQATVNGKTTYRLRVGPFDSRAAAQAAQARLRTLGYDNGFITTK
ncbi:MAG: SPOR domain-containing protein [Burkholderiaceae bacterium]|nr:SPOR domain-containing protein [Burkholderiaceae bacterium]MCD8518029.1 SPOR domain-containing protein [Burkholderiaceae bacterium]MCD8564352.1 SPOR domain-containing protein [Burkholderiaceae bacterium]